MSWPYLARPSDDVSDKGLLSLRLNSTWFCISEGGDVEYGASESSSRDGVGERVHEGGDDGREQPKVSDEQGPLQWEEEKAVEFIQVCLSQMSLSDITRRRFSTLFTSCLSRHLRSAPFCPISSLFFQVL